jgi:DNA-directed RNA polymerase specialized sigma24 family protein
MWPVGPARRYPCGITISRWIAALMDDNSRSVSSPSVREWLESLKHGTDDAEDAAARIWVRYVGQLIREAHRRLKSLPRRAEDGEDIAQEVFQRFFRGVEENRFSSLNDRHDLWKILIMLAERTTIDHIRRQKAETRGGGRVRGHSALGSTHDGSLAGGGFDTLAAPPVTPESADALIRLIQERFPQLANEELQQIALDRASNYSIAEIAQRRGISQRAVERKLDLVRQIVEREARH